MKGDKDRKYKKVSTPELLVGVGAELPYEDDKGRDKQNDYREELEYRAPFQHIQQKMNEMQSAISSLKKTIDQLRNHEHGTDGRPLIPLPDEFGRWINAV